MDTDPAPPETPRSADTVRGYFIAELRRRRRSAGLSQAELGRKINYSDALVCMVETFQRPPTREFTAACDKALGCDGGLLELWPLLEQDAHPKWFRSYVALEAEATALHTFDVQAVPGLLQTEAYARANLGAVWPPKDPEMHEQAVQARLARQKILDRASPPLLWFILDESILIRSVGGAAVMAEQLRHLLALSERPFVRLLVLPLIRAGSAPMDGPFVLMELSVHERVAYVEGPATGRVIVEPAGVEHCRIAFDAIRAQSLPVEDSRDLILRTIGERYERASERELVDEQSQQYPGR